MGVPTSEVSYTIATTRRETTKVHKNMWWHWGGGDNIASLTTLETPNCAVLYYFNVYFNIHKLELFAHILYLLMRYMFTPGKPAKFFYDVTSF